MYQSQQKLCNLENNSLKMGLVFAILIYASAIALCVYFKINKRIETQPLTNITKIDLDIFEIGGGINDNSPIKNNTDETPENLEPTEQENTKEEVLKEVHEEAQIIKPALIQKPKPKPKNKPKVEPKKDEAQKPKEENIKTNSVKSEASNETQEIGGFNSIGDKNRVASSAINSQNTIQSLSVDEKRNIGSQIQAIIAKEAKKNYPRQARLRRLVGTTKISFDYAPQSVLTNIKVIQSSNHQILDETVLKVIERVRHRFPSISAKTSFEIEIKFTLK